MAPANTEMDAGLRLRRARTARGVRDLDRDALRSRQAQDALGPRSDDDDQNEPKSPDSPASPASPSSSSTAPPQATAPPAVSLLPPPPLLPLPLPLPPPPPPPPPPLRPPPRRPGNLAPPPPPPPAQPVQTTSISSTTSRPTNPPVSTVPLPTLPSRIPPALTISTQPGQATNPLPPPPAVANPVDLSTSRSSASSVPTAPFPGSSSSSTSVVVSVVPTPSSAGGSATSPPFRETAIEVPTGTPSSAPASVSTAEPQYQLGPTAAVPGQPLPSDAGSGISDPQSTDNLLSPVAAPAFAGDGGAGLHAGIAVGSVAGTALVSALMFYGYKVYKRRQDSDYLSKPYTSGSSGGGRDGPTGGSVAVVTGVPVGAGATTGLQPGQAFATFDPKTNSQIMNDMFAAVYAAENGQAGMYSSGYNSMASAEYPSEKKMEAQQVQYEVREQYQDQEQEFQTQEQGGRGTVASWLRGTKTPTFPRASWSSRFTAPSWARSSTASTMRASAAFPEGFRPASPLPPVPALPGTGTSNVDDNGAVGTVPAPVSNPNPNAGMVSRWSDSTRQTPPSPSTVRQSESISFRSVVYGTDEQQPQQPSAPAPVAFRSVDYGAGEQKPPIPPIPFSSGQYQPFGPALRRPSASLQKLRTGGDDLAATAAEKEQLAFEVSPLSPESEAITEKPTLASPASPKTRRESGWGRE